MIVVLMGDFPDVFVLNRGERLVGWMDQTATLAAY